MGEGPVADLVRPGLRILFCGINPGRRSAELGRHFAGPGNRFWRVLHGAGLTPELVHPMDQERLLDLGIGITNLVPRATASADQLERDELVAGAERLRRVSAALRPAAVAVLGLGAYRTAFSESKALVGRQEAGLGPAALWVMPNPSGLQAHYSLGRMIQLFAELARQVSEPAAG